VSGKTGEGIEELVGAIGRRLSLRAASAATLTRERHRQAASAGLLALALGKTELLSAFPRNEVAAQHLRDAIIALDSLTGRIDVETVLGEIFASFCIGK
jgi:tRNA modification GTPase